MGMLLKRAMKGQLPLLAAVQKLQEEVLSLAPAEAEEETLFSREQKIVVNIKKIALLTSGLAVQKYMTALEEQQEVLTYISNIVMEAWATESALLRTRKLVESRGEEKTRLHILMIKTYASDAINRVEAYAKEVLAAVSEGDTLRTNLAALRRFLKFAPINTIENRQQLANAVLASGKYPF
jgi:hypothetical protein